LREKGKRDRDPPDGKPTDLWIAAISRPKRVVHKKQLRGRETPAGIPGTAEEGKLKAEGGRRTDNVKGGGVGKQKPGPTKQTTSG